MVSYLDTYRDLIGNWYRESPSLKAIQIHTMLKERGVKTATRTVARYTLPFRKKMRRVYMPLTFLSGEEAQVDWFFVDHPKLGSLSGFAIILSYSRFGFAHLFCRHSFEFFIEGHIMAFKFMDGLPHAIRYDNLKSVVLKKRPLSYNSAFLSFASHYGFEIRLCNIASGNEKGRVERLIRSLRETFLNRISHYDSLKTINKALHDWIKDKNDTIHRATGNVPSLMKKEEKLKSLPAIDFQNISIYPGKKATKTGLIVFDTNYYSFPDYLINQIFILHAYTDRIEIYAPSGKRVASHPRSFEHNKIIINPLHRSFKNLSCVAKRDRIFNVIQNLDSSLSDFFYHNEKVGEDPLASAYHIFKLLKLHARQTILSAVRESLKENIPRINYILSRLQNEKEITIDDVSPQNKNLLLLDYNPRSLEEYDEKGKNTNE